MSRDEWLEKTLADRPPLSPEQVRQLRAVLAPVLPHMRAASAASTTTEAAPSTETPTPERTMQ